MNQEKALTILLAPYLSEKSARLSQDRQYTFVVAKDSTKPEIKEAVQRLFQVEVTAVRVCNRKGKATRFGQRLGRRKDWKKAYVSLAEGSVIDMEATGANE